MGDGSLAFYTGHRAELQWAETSGIDLSDRVDMLAWFKREFAGWSPLWHGLILNFEPGFKVRPQYFFPLDQTWEALPDLTMISDAAHVMPPYAGEGVNMAMLDAPRLAECLMRDASRDTRSAIARLETNMRARASATTKMTLGFTEAFHSPGGIPELMEMFKGHIQ